MRLSFCRKLFTIAAALIPAFLFAQPINFTGQELLGRPTKNSITINVVTDQALDYYFEYGTQSGVYSHQTTTANSVANEPIEVKIQGLEADKKYYYRLVYRKTGSSTWLQRPENSFHTQRPAGTSFAFSITSDSHINVGGLGNSATWQRTLNNVNADAPDFLIDCGDTFSMDNVSSESGARTSYIFQRTPTTFGIVSPSVPIFLAVGNHEQQEAWHLNDNGNPVNSQPVWGANAQKRYFLNPVPDGFYTGNTDPYTHLNGDQLREDYYAWNWGDALFVVIDPYWYTSNKPFIGNTGGGEPGTSDGDRWHWTLGNQQYNWLKQTLENSLSKYKFIFMHNMTGGTQDYIRGGAYAAPFCEWGGYNEDGTTYNFNAKRPTWPATIHELMAANHVSVVFHGHDHQYAYEMLDGVVYQSLPAAGFAGNGFNIYSESNPLSLKVLPSPGHLKVSVSSTSATVDYINSAATGNGANNFSYEVAPFLTGSLPVKLDYFTLNTKENRLVNLKWKTNFENNSSHFFIERAANRGGFRRVGTVAATSHPSGDSYQFTDQPSLNGVYFYRLVQEDNDGKKTYSETRVASLNKYVHWDVKNIGSSWQVSSDQHMRYRLMDLQGRIIEEDFCKGIKLISKPSTGTIFLLQTEINGRIEMEKLMK